MGLGEVLAQEPAHSFRVADLRRQSHESGGDLRVEHRPRQTGNRQQHLQVLARGVHDLGHPGCAEHGRERLQIGEGQRIDAGGRVAARDLHQAQLRTISAFTEELGIQGNACLDGEPRAKFRKCCGAGDYVLQTNSVADLYNPTRIMRGPRRYRKTCSP
jgi:hypothetical protein